MNELVKTDLPADIKALMERDQHSRPSTAAEDNVIPLVYCLQEKMKYTKKTGPDYVEGAEPGMLMLRNAPEPLVKGDVGILFQPCHFTKDFVEWTPRSQGGGIVGRHPTKPLDAKLVPHPEQPKRQKLVTAGGNDLVETANWIGLVIDETNKTSMAYAGIPMKGADHMASKLMNTLMNNVGGQPKPAHLLRLKTKAKHNNMGDWYGYSPEHAGFVFDEAHWGQGAEGKAQYERGVALATAFASNTLRAATDDEPTAAPADDDEM